MPRRSPERAGAAHEQEDTRPMRVPIDRALAALAAGQLHYGAAVLGLQWLALNRGRLARHRARGADAMSAILVAVDGPQAGDWLAALRAHAKGREVRAWPDAVGDRERHRLCLRLAAAARPAGAASESQGDHQSRRRRRSPAGRSRACRDVPIARVAHADLTMRVTEYVVLHVLMHHRRQRLYDAQQRERLWQVHDQPAASEVAVGVMGLGVIGRDAAAALARLGFRVAGLEPHAEERCRASKRFTARPGSTRSCARTEILVCLLPRTPRHRRNSEPRTASQAQARRRGGRRVPDQCRARAVAGRRRHRRGAGRRHAGGRHARRVSRRSRCRRESPLWSHPKVTITPHNAGDISPRVFAPQVIAQIERFERGLPLDNLIDRTRGY